MPRKDEILSELLARKTREIVARSGNYAAFLRTAARNYKYTFREQVLIHAQRPDATACAEIDIWNRLGRRVNRGATGIALLRDPTLKEKGLLHFDAWASTFGETVTAIELAPEGYTLVGR